MSMHPSWTLRPLHARSSTSRSGANTVRSTILPKLITRRCQLPALLAGTATVLAIPGTWRRRSRSCRQQAAREAENPSLCDAGEEVPAYCGILRSPHLDVLIVGVAHYDGGVSGQSARKMIEDFRPDVCLVELDQQRFSRLLADRRGLPWPYLPVRGSKYQPSPLVRSIREVLFSGLELAQNIVGNKEVGGGEEFYEAFLAAESNGALVVPGDLQISNALDGVVKAIRYGFARPLEQIAAGATALFRALGGFARPDYTGEFARASGIAMPMALLADGGWRALPLARATAVGFVSVNVVSFLIGGNGMDQNIEGLQRMDLQGIFDVATALFGLVIALIVGSAYMLSFLESRDSHMASRLLQVTDLMREQKARGVVHCRWLKSSWAAAAPEPNSDGTQSLPPKVLKRAATARYPGSNSTVQKLQFRQRPSEVASSWLPLFTLRRPLEEDEVRNLSLFEPRFLRLFDQLKEAGEARPGLRMAVAYAPVGIERPKNLWQNEAESPQNPEELPPLAVEVEVILDSKVRVVEVQKIVEGMGEDQRRRWRLEVKGTSEVLTTASCNIFSDEFGALWAVPKGEKTFAAVAASEVALDAPPTRCVAVVGLMHVNSMLEQLQGKLEDRFGRLKSMQSGRTEAAFYSSLLRILGSVPVSKGWEKQPVAYHSQALLGHRQCVLARHTVAFMQSGIRPLSPESFRDRGSLVKRHFFQNTWADGEYMDRQFFVASTLHVLLPAAKRNAQLKAIELEPTDGRYIAFLRPGAEEVASKRWYLDEYIAIGKTLWEAESDDVKKLKKEANAQGAKPRFQGWMNPSDRWQIDKSSVVTSLSFRFIKLWASR
ncbi:unnamed protein product [Cladocopium goreaui]|uniref:Uncharacterized protein n=1 Tax=Cladocopium goreaui TaxID=2562237 RepID=A0A9P1BTV1_9DINO|nr:unnamed protein product [Cladocopium goreaui]